MNLDAKCRCAVCEHVVDRKEDPISFVRRFFAYEQYAHSTVQVQAVLDAASAQRDYAVEVARHPTNCAGINCRGVRKCFGCPSRKVETTFLQRKDW
jgi:hypothetical protein